VLARRLFPLAILTTLGFGWLRLKGEEWGLYEPRFGTALFAITLSVVLVALLRWALWTMGKLETERAAARRQLLESKLALEEALRQSELILNHAREIICTVDARGQLVTVSAASEPLLGYGASALLGRSFSELVAPDDRRAMEAAMRQTAAGLAVGSFTARCVRRDGSFAPIAWSIQYSQHSSKTYCVGREADGAGADYSVWTSGG
jgi:PAS domain S-box-containing protein